MQHKMSGTNIPELRKQYQCNIVEIPRKNLPQQRTKMSPIVNLAAYTSPKFRLTWSLSNSLCNEWAFLVKSHVAKILRHLSATFQNILVFSWISAVDLRNLNFLGVVISLQILQGFVSRSEFLEFSQYFPMSLC